MVTIYDPYTAIIELRDAIEAIQLELGVNPGGVYADTRVRLDILEARINNPLVPAPNVENPFFIGNDGVTISTGFGYPTEDRLDGSLYLRQDGYVNEGLYSHRNGTWHRIDTDPWTAAGDLFGVYNFQKVIGLQGRPLSDAMPEDGYHLTWNNSSTIWEPQIGFYASNDLSGTKIFQTVVGIQNRQIDGSTPTDGDVLTWNDANNHWQPQASAVIFDDIVARSNIKANRLLEISTTDVTKSGIVNFGNDSIATDNYTVVVGGYNHYNDYQYCFIGGGLDNSITAPTSYGSTDGFNNILGGTQNGINSQVYSTIVGGAQNYIQSIASTIVGGGINYIVDPAGQVNVILNGFLNGIETSILSAVINGSYNYIKANGSAIVNGSNHNIESNNSLILNGNYGNISGTGQLSLILSGVNHGLLNCTGATIINGDTNYISNSQFGTIISGLGQNVSADYSTIVNGNNNTITDEKSAILNGSNNLLESSRSVILNGVNHTLDVGSDSSVILNGSTNYNATPYVIVGGNNNNISGASDMSNVYGVSNTLLNAARSNVFGDTNSATNSNYANLFGYGNTSSGSSFIEISGYSNSTISLVNFSNIFGFNNVLAAGLYPGDSFSSIFGNNNYLSGKTSYIFGNNNDIEGSYSQVFGQYNQAGSSGSEVDYSIIHGKYGKSSFSGQYVHSTGTLNTSLGSAQYSRLILDGSASSGGAFTLSCLGDSLQFEDDKSYDITLRLLIVNTNGVPTCARYVYDILAHQDSGSLIIDNLNSTILNDNGTGWTVTITAATNQLDITIDSVGVEDRRCMATIEWRELSRA